MAQRLAGEVAPGLFVGGLDSLDAVQELGITHVVTVFNNPSSLQHAALNAPGSSISRHLVDLEDTEEANLLQQLPAAVAFVAAALQSGAADGSASELPFSSRARVLIHCAQGVSRSTSLAAACLMTASPPPGLELSTALAAVRSAWPSAAPNSGFMAQLELFEAMGCRLDESYVPCKLFLLQQAGQQYQQHGCLDASTLPQPQEGAGSAGAGGGGGATLYRCRKCRALVATGHNVVEVEQGPGAAGFGWRKRDRRQRQPAAAAPGSSPAAANTEEGSLFLEPLRWMCEAGAAAAPANDSVVAGAVQGKLYCPKCGVRLGSFNWAGAQSSCGAWVTPAFQLHLSKLDAMEPNSVAPIRQPRTLGGGSSPSAAAAIGTPSAAAEGTPPTAAADGAAAAVAKAAAKLQSASLDAASPKPAPDKPHAAIAASAAGTANGTASSTLAGSTGGTTGSTSGSTSTFFRYLVVDCDGVLVDSERASCEALRRSILAVTGFDIPHAFPQDYQPVFGMDVRSCVEYYQRRFNKPEWGSAIEVAARVSDVKKGIYAELTAGGIAAFPGVAQLVVQAQALGMGVAVASSGSPEKIAHNLGSSGLAHLFPDPYLVVSAKHVARGKPAPDVYIEALRRLGCTEPGRALVVEDAVNGLHAAKAAGTFTVAVATSLPAHMLEPHADLVLQHLAGLDLAAVGATVGGGKPQGPT